MVTVSETLLREILDSLIRLETEGRATNQRIVDMHQALDQRVDDTNKRIEDTNKRIDDTNKRIEDTNKRIDDTNSRIDETNQRIGATNQTMDRLSGRVDKLFYTLVALGAGVIAALTAALVTG